MDELDQYFKPTIMPGQLATSLGDDDGEDKDDDKEEKDGFTAT